MIASTVLKRVRELPEYEDLDAPQLMTSLFPNLRYTWIVRRDKVRQADKASMLKPPGNRITGHSWIN